MTDSTINGAVPIVPYTDPRAAISWLEETFAATATLIVPPEPDQPLLHAEVRIGTAVVMVDDADRTDSPFAFPGPVAVYVVVDDPDALHDHVVSAGGDIVMGLTDQEYGSREFAARDPHGNVWSFGTYRPSLG